MNVWNNQQVIKNQTAGVEVEFKRYPEDRQLFIEDLRKVDYRLTGIDQTFPLDVTVNPITETSVNTEVIDSINNFYTEYYDKNLNTFNTIAGIPVGAPLVLNVESYKDTWDEAEFSWMDATDTGDDHLEWNNWWKQNIYEVEWIISGPNGYLKTYRGSIDTYSKLAIVLPFAGDYSIELGMYDLFNVRSSYRKTDYINVKKLLNNYCELNSFKNIHIIDGSSIKNGLHFPTYFLMLHARCISKKIIIDEKKKKN